jgi:hypothetical protein
MMNGTIWCKRDVESEIRAWTRDNLVDWIWENAVDHESETWEDGLEEWAKQFFYD